MGTLLDVGRTTAVDGATLTWRTRPLPRDGTIARRLCPIFPPDGVPRRAIARPRDRRASADGTAA